MDSNVLSFARKGEYSYNEENVEFYGIHEKLDEVLSVINDIRDSNVNSLNRLEYINEDNNKVINEKDVILRRIDLLFKDLISEFDDEIERLQYVCLLKEQLKKLKKITNKSTDKYYYRSCIIIHDSIVRLKAENLTEKQVEVLKYLIGKLQQNSIDSNEFDEIDEILVQNDLDWIPECE